MRSVGFDVRYTFFVSIVAFLFFIPTYTLAYTALGTPNGYVNDYAALLSEGEHQDLERQLAEYEQTSGNEIVIAIIKNLGGDTIENFAEKLFVEWGIGKKGKDNGVLVLVALDDRKIRIEVGYGLEPVLTDAESYLIIERSAKPAFQKNDYAKGLRDVVRNIKEAISADMSESSGPSEESKTRLHLDLSPLSLVLCVWIASMLARSKSWWAGGILGAAIGSLFGFISGFFYVGIIAMSVLTALGLLFDFLISREYQHSVVLGKKPRWWAGGSGFSRRSSGGGFGGFGGGRSGGGGASGGW